MALAPKSAKRIVNYAPQPGPQEIFLRTNADIAIYGGAAGGGKTYALLLDGLRGVKRRTWTPVIFRRTYKQITAAQALWDKACEMYPNLGGRMRQTQMDCVFQSGSRITFSHMEHENDKINWQGTEIPLVAWDELTHFSASQFWYLVSRMRSMGPIKPYMRGTCNPEPGSWVAELLDWWIDPTLGTPIPERAGVVRYFCRLPDDSLEWADTREELLGHGSKPVSFTFIPATLADNKALLAKDPEYGDRLKALPRAEREALLGGNWLYQTGGVYDASWFTKYSIAADGTIQVVLFGDLLDIQPASLRRFAIIDTAGTSKERAEEARGKEPSWSVCQVWDFYKPRNLLLLRSTCRIRAEWNELKQRFNDFLGANDARLVFIENAHFGPALAKEISGRKVRLIGPKIPGMAENHRGAKLERAVAAGAIARVEDGLVAIPDTNDRWVREYVVEHTAWQGRPDEVADQIDGTSYAVYVSKEMRADQWGGTIQGRHGSR